MWDILAFEASTITKTENRQLNTEIYRLFTYLVACSRVEIGLGAEPVQQVVGRKNHCPGFL